MGWNDNDTGDRPEEDDETEDFTFSRESIVRQWTPLTFAAQWIVVACLKCLAVLDVWCMRWREGCRGVLLLLLLLLFFVEGRLGEVWELCSFESFQVFILF